MSVQVSYKKQILLGIMFLAVVLFVLETGLRIAGFDIGTCTIIENDVYADLDYFSKAEICRNWYSIDFRREPTFYYLPDQHTTTFNINSHGFRGPDILEEKPENTYRIFVIGGSTVLSAAATSDETTIPGYLQKKFDKADLDFKVEVINAGVASSFSLLETNLVKEKIIHFDPDLLIGYNGWNDIKKSLKTHEGEKYKFSTIDLILEDLRKIFPFYKTPHLLRQIQAEMKQEAAGYQVVNGVNLHRVSSTFNPEGIEEKVSLWKERWIEICELGKKEGFDAIIILQPIVGTGNKTLTKQEYASYIVQDNKNIVPYYQLYAEELDQMRAHCIDTADFRGVFDNENKTIYFDAGHVGSEGSEIVAQRLFELTLPLVRDELS